MSCYSNSCDLLSEGIMKKLICILFIAALSLPAMAEPPAAEPANVIKVPLQFQPDAFSATDYVDTAGQDFAFKKEPQYAGRRVVRGAFPDGTPYAIDAKALRLYVDFNANGDLTDDPGHSYPSSDSTLLKFKGVRLPRKKGPGQEPVMLDFETTDNPGFYCRFKSGWSGTARFGEREFKITLPDSFSETEFGFTIKVAPAGLDDLLTLDLDPDGFLGVGDHAYSAGIETADTTATAVFREITQNTGEMALEAYAAAISAGTYDDVDRAKSVVFPEGTFRLPRGAYTINGVYLKSDKGLLFSASTYEQIQAREKRRSVQLGQPLNETLTFQRIANRLQFSYRLEGKGHEDYCLVEPLGRLPNIQDQNAPTLTVKQGEKVLLSTPFDTEYG